MADFEDMTRPELVALCTARGLPTYGAKPALAERLRAAGEGAALPAEAPPAAAVEPEPEVASERPKATAFRAVYDIDELDDDEHAELCARIVAAAREAGHRTRGGGRRVSGDHRRATYEVSVR